MSNITSLGQARDYGDRLSKLLKKYRELATFRLTQQDLAKHLGVSARSVRDWETGINLPTARNLKNIIEVFHRLGLFSPGKEREEAEELWILRQGNDLNNTFPLFDASWLESVTSNKKPDNEVDQQLPDPPTNDAETIEKVVPIRPVSTNLPQHLTSFIGREKELVVIRQLLLKTRLLTIIGTGGAGKTRLSQEVAKSLQEASQVSYPDGVWWVELTPLTDQQQVVQAVISILMPEGRQEGDLYDLLRNYLQLKKLLLVLDNCEHLVEAVAGLVRKLLRDCSSLQILATSRESLNLAGEQVWPLEGLNVPLQKQSQQPEGSAAVQLFVERAWAAQPLFDLTTENKAAVLEICRQLDGLPLAIELAAARVKGLGVEQISRRLQRSFKLLSGGSQANVPHHQTVQAMIDWSYNLLTGEEQLLLRRMAVFRGDFSLEAAEAVLGGDAGPDSERLDPDEVLILMLQLVNKSLVVAVSGETHTEARYRLLEMVRQYSQEKLEASGEAAYLSYKHCAFYTVFAEKGYPNFLSNQSPKWVERLEQENTNLRSALSWALAPGQRPTSTVHLPVPPGELALRLSAGLGRFWQLKSFSEGQRWLKESLAQEGLAGKDEIKAVRALAYFYLGNISINQNDQAMHFLTLSVSLFEELGDKFYMVAALTNLGWMNLYKGSVIEAKAYLLRSLALIREIEDQFYLGYILSHLGWVALYQGDLDEALAFLQKSEPIHRLHNDYYLLAEDLLYLAEISRIKQNLPQALSKARESAQICREIGYKPGIALALTHLSMYQRNLQNYGEARLAAEEAATICEEEGDNYSLSYAYHNLALINKKEGKVVEAGRFGRQSLDIRQKNGDKKGIMQSLHIFALLAAAQDRWEEYVWLYTAANTLRQQLGISRDHMNEQTEFDRLKEQASFHLDPATLDRLKVKGHTDSLDDIVKQVLAN